MLQSVELLRTLLPQKGRIALACGPTPWDMLFRMQLGVNACNVCAWNWQPGVDGSADGSDDSGRDVSRQPSSEPGNRYWVVASGSSMASSSSMAPKCSV